MPDISTEDLELYECFKCKKKLNKDYYCSGCGHAICDECDVNYNMPFGSHLKELHLLEASDD